jgi:hypothetical protein
MRVAEVYTADAILLGTVSPVISEGTDAIVKFYTPKRGTGNTNELGERRTIVWDDNAVVVTGFFMSLPERKRASGCLRRPVSLCWW